MCHAIRCAGGYYIGRISGQADFPGAILISLVGYFFACYYFLQVGYTAAQLVAVELLASSVLCHSIDCCQLVLCYHAGNSYPRQPKAPCAGALCPRKSFFNTGMPYLYGLSAWGEVTQYIL
jgi:hypothetical protein